MTIRRSIELYFRMSRPDQLLLVAAVYGWGVLIALSLPETRFDLASITAGLIPLIFVSASIHYANEYADYETDALTVRTRYSGGSGAMQDYHASRTSTLKAAWLSLISGLSVAFILITTGPLPVVTFPILALGAFGGWMYSLRPLALAWRGWGEATNAFLGGLLLPVMGYAVIAGRIDWQIILLTLPFALLAFDNLLATTWPDRSADEHVGKYTLATRWSVRRLRILYVAVWASSFLVVSLLHGRLLPPAIYFATLLLLPVVIWASRAYTRQQSPFPTVMLMLLYLFIQMVGWTIVVVNPDLFPLTS